MALPSQSKIRPVLLEVLAAAGGRAPAAEVMRVVTERFSIDPADLAALFRDGHTFVWQHRLQVMRNVLVHEGLMDGSERGIWQLTKAEQLEDRPLPTPGPPRSRETTADLVSDLRGAATDSAHPSRLEEACARAFRTLGFDAEVIGGPGNTDVVVSAPLGANQYTVVIDAKSTSHVRVADAQVDWLSIKQHRERQNADFACVVGPSFGGGHLIERATAFGIVLLLADELIELIELHASAPFALIELRPLFESAPLAKTSLPHLRVLARDRLRLQLLVERVLVLIDNFNRLQPDLVVAKPETLQALMLASQDEGLRGTTISEVSRVLSLLEAAGVLTAWPTGGYASTTSIAGARLRMASLVPVGSLTTLA